MPLVLLEVHLHLNLALLFLYVPRGLSPIILFHFLLFLWFCGLSKPWRYSVAHRLQGLGSSGKRLGEYSSSGLAKA